MKFITKPFIGFIATVLVVNVVFSLDAQRARRSRQFAGIHSGIGTAFCVMLLAGYVWGRKDSQYLPIHDVGFRFHLATYLTCMLVWELWFLLGFNSPYETIWNVHYTMMIWGLFLIAHLVIFLVARKKAIRGLHREDIFD